MQFTIAKSNKSRRKRVISICAKGIIYLIMIIIFSSILDIWPASLYIFMPLVMIDVVPAIYLYKEYLHFNKDSILEINPEEKKISFTTAGNVIESTFMDIKKIVIYLSPNDYRNTGLRFIETDFFLFARFELKNGQEFYVTSLMIPKLKEFVKSSFKGTSLIFHPWLYSSILLVNYFRKGNVIKKQELS